MIRCCDLFMFWHVVPPLVTILIHVSVALPPEAADAFEHLCLAQRRVTDSMSRLWNFQGTLGPVEWQIWLLKGRHGCLQVLEAGEFVRWLLLTSHVPPTCGSCLLSAEKRPPSVFWSKWLVVVRYGMMLAAVAVRAHRRNLVGIYTCISL